MPEKHIEMLLEHGNMKGIIQCTMSGWAGCAYRIPRPILAEASRNPELNKSGVYCLINIKEQLAYVGQGGKRRDDSGVLKRVSRHDLDTEAYWDTAIVFIDRYKNLSSTEISYLEHHFYQLAKSSGRFKLMNGQIPPDGSPGRGIICDMNFYLSGAKLIMEAMGYDVFEPVEVLPPSELTSPATPVVSVKTTTKPSIPGTHYTLSRTIGNKWTIQAKGVSTGDGKFIVLKGSLISPGQTTRPRLSRTLQELRAAHCQPSECCELSQDIEFSSLTTAANFLIGNLVNGLKYWKAEKN